MRSLRNFVVVMHNRNLAPSSSSSIPKRSIRSHCHRWMSATSSSSSSFSSSQQGNSTATATTTTASVIAATGFVFGLSYKDDLLPRISFSGLSSGFVSSLEQAGDCVVDTTGDGDEDDEDSTTDVINWSGTHKVTVSNENFWEPESVSEVEEIVKSSHEQGKTVRPLGSSLSPNGIALNKDGMISMANVDRVLDIDTKNNTITVEAGITVSKVVEALRPHGLTLPNLASIAEQQMGGFVSVGAHGTGRLIASVDEYVTKLKIVTPGKGTITLTKEDHGRLFELARVGLGCLGVVVEVTMECIPAHKLVEHTFVLTREEAISKKDQLLKEHKHMRFMWIPYTDAVVVVTNDPENDVADDIPRNQTAPGTTEERSKPLTDLLENLSDEYRKSFSADDVKGMGFGELRDSLLAFNPLDVDHVKRCNQAEADFWKVNEGYRTLQSDKLLQFDCGGQQWVFEVCFETGTQEENNDNDMVFMKKLLDQIETNRIPAHSPIEQRWSASSSSPMSPSHGERGGLHTWVGIINYLPSDDPKQREDITNLFTGKYCDLVRSIGRPYKLVSHWAKLEEPKSVWK
eukprot:CAMPEP_0113486334 /NCGR_PEP_ID=MMETSP0014_2-20120614/24943_1 /TAXON_ID=2857 /ORGANISM="Nitzschia sp." /LENGTH=572 /DNA_ID=CAMNT_0000380003 /DNA_START=73 /DNA_END=1788 /DNA_ORIENTATION=+ /assembly_acc=CAM_ASM_000159